MKKINSQDRDNSTTVKPGLERRILGRRVAKELSADDLHSVTGGTTSCSSGSADDCDVQPH